MFVLRLSFRDRSDRLVVREGIAASFIRNQDEMAWTINHKACQTRFDFCLNSAYKDYIQASPKASESWSRPIPPQQVIDDTTSKIEGWPDYANRLILMTPKDKLVDFELVWRDPQPIWTSKSGRIVQIGDAAHTFLPTSGNGANQGMEDAISLAKCLRIAGKDNVAEAARVHNKLRYVTHHLLPFYAVPEERERKRN